MRKMTIINEIQKELFAKQDLKFKEFHSKLIPTTDEKSIIGVRTPDLRSIAKKIASHPDIEKFLSMLPHEYYDENQVHAFILSLIKDYDDCVSHIDAFLPFIDNWATCDQMRPKVFAKKQYRERLLKDVERWINAPVTNVYTVRFGIETLMSFFLDENFNPKFLKWVSKIRSEEYYLNMMVAWFFATALAKQYEATLPFIEKHVLAPWTHNKTIQKAVESYRITDEQKTYLKTLKL
nr:DNA alkylation repair protein [Fibrobacter sp.]